MSDDPSPMPDPLPVQQLYLGNGLARETADFPPAPPWRRFSEEDRQEKGAGFRINPELPAGARTVDMVNAALRLRRPLLVTGKPGSGKSTLAHAVAHELSLGEVLVWPVTTKTTLESGLYRYDAIGRLNAAAISRQLADKDRERNGDPDPADPGQDHRRAERTRRRFGLSGIGRFIQLGPLGTALLPALAYTHPARRGGPDVPDDRTSKPRILLIDEVDKGDIDLPNDLLHVFETGWFDIPELSRLPKGHGLDCVRVRTHGEERFAWITRGHVQCDEFPLVIMTSNGEREFPPAFLRRCLRLEMGQPNDTELAEIVASRLGAAAVSRKDVRDLIRDFYNLREGLGGETHKHELAVDQLLNAVHLILHDVDITRIRAVLFQSLTETS